MTGQAFERLLYTDCRPGEGLKGGPGYQVQAQSPGVSSTQSAMAVKWLLYETQMSWVNDGRAVEDFPEGLAHAAEAGYATSQGLYLGKEANGFRQGNFLSDCILTEQKDLYGIIRPAQLWQSSMWRREIWPSTTAPLLEEGIDFGPIDFDAIHDWLGKGNNRPQGLERLLTILEDPDGPRVAIKSDGPGEALFWIAAATILLPIEKALSLSFSVFVRSIDKAPHRIVAVPASLNRDLSPGSGRTRMFVIDTATDATDEVAPSANASFWVRQLVAVEEPYEVVEAVETAARYGGQNEQEISDARAAAMAVCSEGWAIEDAPGVGRWVQRAFGTPFEEDAKSVIERLVNAEDVRVSDLRVLDQLASDGMVSVNRSELRGRLFDAELAEVQAGGVPQAEQLPNGYVDRRGLADQGSAVVSAMLLSDDTQAGRLLSLAWRHGLSLLPPTPALIDRIRTMVTAWIGSPTQVLPLGRWALKDIITDELHQQVRGVYEAGDERRLQMILPHTVSYLLRRGNDLADAFTMEIEGCYTASIRQPEERLARVKVLLKSLEARPELWYERYQNALVKWSAADTPTCAELVGTIPAAYSLNATVLELATEDVLERVRRGALTADLLRTIDRLRERGQLPGDKRLRRIAASAAVVDDFMTALDAHQRIWDYSVLGEHLKAVQKADEDVLELSIPAFAQVAAEAANEVLGQSILRFLRERSGIYFGASYAPYLKDPRMGYSHAQRMLVWITDADIPQEVRRSLRAQLLGHYRGLPDKEQSDWHRAVANYPLPRESRELFDQFIDSSQKEGRRRRGPWGKD